MQAVILAGGFGTRISEDSHFVPKPMIEIGGKPILWHILKIYSAHGINDFIICCGYRGHLIKQYFANYFTQNSDLTIDLSNNSMTVHNRNTEFWKVTLVDTGLETMTGGRIRRIRDYLNGPFCLTYGDGVSDINISELIKFHQDHKKLVTVSAVQPEARFGILEVNHGNVKHFTEKPLGDGVWVNGGFFVCQPDAINYIEDDTTVWEQDPLKRLTADNQLMAFEHTGFWQPMDTKRDHVYLEKLWKNSAPWKVW